MRHFHFGLLVALFLSMFCAAFSGCDPSEEEAETPLEYGFETRTNFACEKAPILDALLQVCNAYASCTMNQSCANVTQELFAGTTLETVAVPKETYWNEFGGRGQLMAESSLCMLKELANGDGVVNQADAKLFGAFPVSVKQKVGFLHFDPDARLMDGYQTVSICLPIAGCFDAKEASFRGELKQRSPAHPLDKSCGNFPVEDSWALRFTTEDLAQSLSVIIPDIDVNTPYGPIKVKPRFDYYSDLHMIQFPHPNDTYARLSTDHNEVHLHDVYGRIPGVNLSIAPLDTTPSGVPFDTGWMSQLAVGSRQTNPNAPLWTRDPDHPTRPDFDLSQARSELERKPVAGGKAEVEVSYSPPLPSVLTDGDPIKTDLTVKVTPVVIANFASQFDVFFNELTNSLRDAGPTLMVSATQMLARAEAYASFEVTAGLDIFMEFESSFGNITVIDEHPKTHLILTANGSADQKTVGTASSTYDPRYNAEPALNDYQDLSNGAQRNPTQFVKECVAKPVADQPKPVATMAPGNSDILEYTQFPCNICVGHEAIAKGNDVAAAYSTIVYPSANGGPANWTCNEYHTGCFDMCDFDTATHQLTIARTAISMGLRGLPRNIACNENPPK